MLFPFFWMRKLELKNEVSSGVGFLAHRWKEALCMSQSGLNAAVPGAAWGEMDLD